VVAGAGRVQRAVGGQISRRLTVTAVRVAVASERVAGGRDVSQSLASGKASDQAGLLDTRNGALLINGAERLDTTTASVLAGYLDNRNSKNTVLILIDESDAEEAGLAETSLAERLALMVELPVLPVAELQRLLDQQPTGPSPDDKAIGDIVVADSLLREMTQLASRLGVLSLRSLWYCARVAKGHAALHGKNEVDIEDAAVAAQLVLAPRACAIEQSEPPPDAEQQESANDDSSQEDQQPPPDGSAEQTEQTPQEEPEENQREDIAEQLLEAAMATLPQHLIASLVRGQNRQGKAGRSAGVSSMARGGRPAGVRRPRGSLRDQRLNIVETLKAAAPKQRLRGNSLNEGLRLQVRVEDFRITRYKQPSRTTTVFVVDASGSSALNRLAEAKGAVELLLAECYVRRDRVALISFRGTDARLELAPTRSLVRAKRELAGLPGGGGTPLAAGLQLADKVVQQLMQAGEIPVVVIMTDGKANIASDGEACRKQAMEDAHAAARQLASRDVKCLFIDTAPRARPQARELSDSLKARYLPLPSTDRQMLPDLIRA